MHQYEERYVAFLDVLGFSSLVNRAEADATLLERLASALEEVRTYSEFEATTDSLGSKVAFWENMFRMSTFSDSILISTKLNLIGLGLITLIGASICHRLLHQGIFTRGAISKGKLIHTSTIAVGAGLIKAYELEKRAAVYPRILIDDAVVHDMDVLRQGSPDLRRQDFDGLWHLHILHPTMLEMGQRNSQSQHPVLNKEYMALGRQEIENALRSSEDLAVKAKIHWLAKYFNQYAVDFGLQEIQVS